MGLVWGRVQGRGLRAGSQRAPCRWYDGTRRNLRSRLWTGSMIAQCFASGQETSGLNALRALLKEAGHDGTSLKPGRNPT